MCEICLKFVKYNPFCVIFQLILDIFVVFLSVSACFEY